MQYEQGRGFYFSLPTDEVVHELPPIFINISRKRKLVRFSTLELAKKNNRINEALNEVLLMSEESVEALISAVQVEVGFLYKASEALGLLDMVGIVDETTKGCLGGHFIKR